MMLNDAVSYCAERLSVLSPAVTVALDDGSELRVKMEPDYDTSLESDGDWFGKVQSADYGDKRPEGFDGNAEKMRARNCAVWWQPPKDVQRGTESFKRLRDRVAGYYLEEWSYCGLVVERTVHHPTDSRFTREVEASLWCIEDDADRDYLRDTLADLFREVAD